MFLLNRSFSMFASFSFRFIAPGRLFKLLCLMIAPPTVMSSFLECGASGKATARDSRLVTNFLEGRRRFFDVTLVFSMREMRAECLIVRLSFLDVIPNIPRSFPLSLLRFDGGLTLVGCEPLWLKALLPAVGLVGACKLSAIKIPSSRGYQPFEEASLASSRSGWNLATCSRNLDQSIEHRPEGFMLARAIRPPY